MFKFIPKASHLDLSPDFDWAATPAASHHCPAVTKSTWDLEDKVMTGRSPSGLLDDDVLAFEIFFTCFAF